MSNSVYGLEDLFQIAIKQVEADRHLGGGGCVSRCNCLPDSIRPTYIHLIWNEEKDFRKKWRDGAGIDALTKSPEGLTVEKGMEGEPATLNLRNVPYYLLRALNQVDVTQYRVSTVTTHGHGAAEVTHNPVIRST